MIERVLYIQGPLIPGDPGDDAPLADGPPPIELFPDSVRRLLPAYGSQEGVDDPLITVRFYHPHHPWVWYAYEGSPMDEDRNLNPMHSNRPEDDFLFFGWVDGDYPELGEWTLSQLARVRALDGPEPRGIIADTNWTPVPLSSVMKK